MKQSLINHISELEKKLSEALGNNRIFEAQKIDAEIKSLKELVKKL